MFFGKVFIRGVAGFAQFVLNLYSQLPDATDTDALLVGFMAINGQKQACDQSRVDLYHQPIPASGDQVAFPPCKELFDFPTELIRFGDLPEKITQGMILIATVTNTGLPRIKDWTYKRPFTAISIC
ncbi:MAG: hypothetical protein B5M56_01975 [Desulfococcus sp. 4484_241]|nr:MAG: hypothetical protein B5M56_01975 [Desulfococcus sp. 4484_241]